MVALNFILVLEHILVTTQVIMLDLLTLVVLEHILVTT